MAFLASSGSDAWPATPLAVSLTPPSAGSRFHRDRHFLGQAVGICAQRLVAFDQRRGRAGDHVAPFAHGDSLYLEPFRCGCGRQLEAP